jgi:hypothetical protein
MLKMVREATNKEVQNPEAQQVDERARGYPARLTTTQKKQRESAIMNPIQL